MLNFIIKHYKVVLLNTYDAEAGCGLWLGARGGAVGSEAVPGEAGRQS